MGRNTNNPFPSTLCLTNVIEFFLPRTFGGPKSVELFPLICWGLFRVSVSRLSTPRTSNHWKQSHDSATGPKIRMLLRGSLVRDDLGSQFVFGVNFQHSDYTCEIKSTGKNKHTSILHSARAVTTCSPCGLLHRHDAGSTLLRCI